MIKRGVVVGLVTVLLSMAGEMGTSAQAAPAMPQAQNPCAKFYELQKGRLYDVVDVQILGVKQGVVDIMVLGLPKRINATINGIDVNRQQIGSKQIVCGREAIGNYISYDLNALKMDAGFFQVNADGVRAGKALQLK